MNIDRRDIAPLLLPFFPTMEAATSDDWHYFLDVLTGLDTPLDTPNGQAFDQWRSALADMGYPVTEYDDASIAAMKAKAALMLDAEQKRAASLNTTLVELAKEAPNLTVAEMVSGTKG